MGALPNPKRGLSMHLYVQTNPSRPDWVIRLRRSGAAADATAQASDHNRASAISIDAPSASSFDFGLLA